MITCAFMYIAPGLDPLKQHAVIPSEDVPMYVVGVGNYDQAEAIATELSKIGCDCIDLCPGFGVEGVARIKKACGPSIAVGAVRFDYHPAFEFQSGDALFK